MLPISPCNTVGARLVLVLALLIITSMALTPTPGEVQQSVNDKLGHALAFLLLAFLVHTSWPRSQFGWRQFSALLGYGVALETAQHFIPNRYFSLLDLLADLAGIALYILMIPLVRVVLVKIMDDASELSKSVNRSPW